MPTVTRRLHGHEYTCVLDDPPTELPPLSPEAEQELFAESWTEINRANQATARARREELASYYRAMNPPPGTWPQGLGSGCAWLLAIGAFCLAGAMIFAGLVVGVGR
jgi:hypothetical protein